MAGALYRRKDDNSLASPLSSAQAGFIDPRIGLLAPLDPISADTVPDDTSTNATVTVGGPRIISGIDTIGDQDFYSVTLIAGHAYRISMTGYQPSAAGDPVGPTGAPLSDSFLELRDANGQLITSADGGDDTTFNTVNSGLRRGFVLHPDRERNLLYQRPRVR